MPEEFFESFYWLRGFSQFNNLEFVLAVIAFLSHLWKEGLHSPEVLSD
jgi:hypothetical protein